MQKKELIILPNKRDLSCYKKYNLNTFLLPLKDYSIGFDTYFDIEEINEISKNNKVYVILNKFLHLKINEFKKIYKTFNENILFLVEDIGLTNVIDKERIVLYENHIISNYKSINFLKDIGYNNIVINNDLTINEIKDIIKNTKSNLYYFYTSKNMLMYSRRNLVTNYNKYYNIKTDKKSYNLKEKLSKKILSIKEEQDGSVVRYNKIFCASKYLNDLDLNLIIDFSSIDKLNESIILENLDNDKLCDLIDSDYYFLENDIKYKVGDLK